MKPCQNKKTGRRAAAHFQYISEDIGQQDLRDHLLQLIAIMKISQSWNSFIRNFSKAFPSSGDEQLGIDLGEEDED